MTCLLSKYHPTIMALHQLEGQLMKITDKCATNTDSLIYICDYSPPRAATANYLETDYICVAYNPGRQV